MILLFIFIIGCFVTAIVALGMVFAMAAFGYGAEGYPDEPVVDSQPSSPEAFQQEVL